MAGHLLDITTLIEQPTIKINGTTHEILHPDQLGVIDFHRLSIMAGRVSDLMKKSSYDDSDADALTAVIVDLTDRIMDGIPADVRAKLTESQRLAVAEVFMMLPRVKTKATRKAASNPKASRSIGAKPRRGSSDSTAATPPAG